MFNGETMNQKNGYVSDIAKRRSKFEKVQQRYERNRKKKFFLFMMIVDEGTSIFPEGMRQNFYFGYYMLTHINY